MIKYMQSKAKNYRFCKDAANYFVKETWEFLVPGKLVLVVMEAVNLADSAVMEML